MSSKKRRTFGDPRKAGGTIAGPGGPRDKNAVIISMENAVLLDGTNVALVETERNGVRDPDPAIAMALSGRINKTDERSEILYVFDADGAAALISELLALASRVGDEFFDQLYERIEKLHTDDAVGESGIGTVG